MPEVIALDARLTKLAKPDYWNNVFRRYANQTGQERFFHVAERTGGEGRRLVGFIMGEIRAWEFGSAPCGWVFALSVDPKARLGGIGSAMLDAIAADFRAAGVRTMRTMVARRARLPLLFFRSEGMTAGPYIQLEKDLD